jgi:hypothetical protein
MSRAAKAASSVVSFFLPAMLCELGRNHKWAGALREDPSDALSAVELSCAPR